MYLHEGSSTFGKRQFSSPLCRFNCQTWVNHCATERTAFVTGVPLEGAGLCTEVSAVGQRSESSSSA